MTYPGGFLFAKLWSGRTDITALELVHFFGDDKFRTLFSFLFGLGFAIQIGRAVQACFSGLASLIP